MTIGKNFTTKIAAAFVAFTLTGFFMCSCSESTPEKVNLVEPIPADTTASSTPDSDSTTEPLVLSRHSMGPRVPSIVVWESMTNMLLTPASSDLGRALSRPVIFFSRMPNLRNSPEIFQKNHGTQKLMVYNSRIQAN